MTQIEKTKYAGQIKEICERLSRHYTKILYGKEIFFKFDKKQLDGYVKELTKLHNEVKENWK